MTQVKDRIVKTLKAFRWQQWVVLFAFAFTLGVTGFEIYRAVTATRHWRHHREEPIRAWMTIPHVAHTYHVPARELYEALGLPPPAVHPDRRPLRMIAHEQNRSVEQVREILKDAIQRAQAAGEYVPDHHPRGRPEESNSPPLHERREHTAPSESSPRPSERGTP